MTHCHCSICRKHHGAPFATYVHGPLDGFRLLAGSGVPRMSLERKVAVIPAGSLDSDPGARPSAHIFVGSKASWFDITDGLPQFQEMPT
jgi:hypothetical protein